MRVRLNDGNIVDVPDSVPLEQARAYIDTHYIKPSLGERVGGNLLLGAAGMSEKIGNLTNLLGLGKQGLDIAERIKSQPLAAKIESQPAESMLGSLGEGLVRFLPELPLYAVGELAALRGLSMLPKGARVVEALKPIRGEGILPSTAKAVPRAALGGAVVGSVAGVPAEADIVERLKEGGIEAAQFAAAVSVLHPAFMGLRMAVGKALGKHWRRVTDADMERYKDLDERARLIQNDPELNEAVNAYFGIEGTPKSFNEAYSRYNRDMSLLDMETGKPEPEVKGKKKVEKKRVEPKPKPKEEPSDTQDTTGLQGSERVGEEPGRTVQDEGTGTTETATGRVLQEPTQGKAEAKPTEGLTVEEAETQARDILTKAEEKIKFERLGGAARKSVRKKAKKEALAVMKRAGKDKLPEPLTSEVSSVQNLDKANYTKEELGLPQEADAVDIEAAAEDRLADEMANLRPEELTMDRLVMLVREGYTPEQIDSMSVGQIRELLNRMPETVDRDLITKSREAARKVDISSRITEAFRERDYDKVEALTKAQADERAKDLTTSQERDLANRIEGKASEHGEGDITEEGIAEADKAINDVMAIVEKPEEELTEADLTAIKNLVGARIDVVDDVIKRSLGSPSRLNLIKERVGVLKSEGRLKEPTTEAAEGEIETSLEDTTTPKATTGKREVKTAEDWENLLTEEGMPGELDFEGKADTRTWEDTTFDFMGLQQMYEMAVENLRKLGPKIESTNKHLVAVSRGIMTEEPKKFSEFRVRLKEVAGDLWDSIKHMARKLWQSATEWYKNSRIGNERGYLGSVNAASYNDMVKQGRVYTEKRLNRPEFERADNFATINDAELGSLAANPRQDATTLNARWLLSILRYTNLYNDYPFLEKVKVGIRDLPGNTVASWHNPEQVLFLDTQYTNGFLNGRLNRATFLGTIMHEVQHAIDYYEGRITFMGRTPSLASPDIMSSLLYICSKYGDGSNVFTRAQDQLLGATIEGKSLFEFFTLLNNTFKERKSLIDTISKLQRNTFDYTGVKTPRHIKDELATVNIELAKKDIELAELQGKVDALSSEKDIKYVLYLMKEYENRARYVESKISPNKEFVFDENDPLFFSTATDSSVVKDLGDAKIVVDDLKTSKEIVKNERGVKIAERLQGEPINVLKNKVDEKDISPIMEYISSPTNWSRGTLAESHVTNLNKAEMLFGHVYSLHATSLRAAEALLTKEERATFGDVLRGKRKAASNGEIQAQEAVQSFLGSMRERYKLFLRDQYKRHLSADENAALQEIISGVPEDVVFEKYRWKEVVDKKTGKAVNKPNLDQEVLRDIVKEYNEIDKWGLEDYVPNVELGRYKLVTKDGAVVAVGMSRKDATRKAINYLERNQDATELYLDTKFTSWSENATGLSRRQYWSMVGRLKVNLTKQLEGLNTGVAEHIAKKAMKRQFIVKPTDKFSQFAQERKDVLIGEQEIFPVLFNYAYSMEKKMHLDPVLHEIRRALPDMPQNLRSALQSLAEDVKGRYHFSDKLFDFVAEKFGWRMRGASRAVASVRALETNLKLGYRPVAAAINFASGQGHVWVKTGSKYYAEAVKYLHTPEGRKFLTEVEPWLGMDFVQESTGKLASKKPIGVPLGMFQKPEVPNREVGVLANYLFAMGEMGMSEIEAREFAIRANWFQNFTYNMANLPRMLRSPMGKLLGQFKPYFVKELEFIRHLKGAEVARYIGMQMALAGPRGYVMVLRSLPIIGLMPWWDEIEGWFNKEYPQASRGIGGALGVDVSAPATFQFPSEMRDWMGPALSDLVNFKKTVLQPMLEGVVQHESKLVPIRGAAEVQGWLGTTIPIFRHYSNMIDQVIDKDGWVKDERGRRMYQIDNVYGFAAKSIAGATDIEMSKIRTAERVVGKETRRVAESKMNIIDSVLERVSKGEPIDDELRELMIRYHIKPSSLRRAAKFRVLDPMTRRLLLTEVARRPEIIDLYPE